MPGSKGPMFIDVQPCLENGAGKYIWLAVVQRVGGGCVERWSPRSLDWHLIWKICEQKPNCGVQSVQNFQGCGKLRSGNPKLQHGMIYEMCACKGIIKYELNNYRKIVIWERMNNRTCNLGCAVVLGGPSHCDGRPDLVSQYLMTASSIWIKQLWNGFRILC